MICAISTLEDGLFHQRVVVETIFIENEHRDNMKFRVRSATREDLSSSPEVCRLRGNAIDRRRGITKGIRLRTQRSESRYLFEVGFAGRPGGN